MTPRSMRACLVPSSRLWWAVPTLLLSCLIATADLTARADEPFGVKLLRPDSLAGWDHGLPAPSGWKIAGGRLEGSGDASPLSSGWTFGQFELRFAWSTADGGAWTISLPEVPDRKGLAVVLCDGDGCGAIFDGDKKLAPGAKVEATQAKMHTAAIRRTGAKLLVTVDGRMLAEVDVAPARRFGLGLAVAKGKAALADLRLEEPPGKPIFNGKNLDGWWTPGNLGAWKVQDDQITLNEHGGNYIRTKKLYANFTLYAEYKIAAGGNSGIGIRTPRDGWPSGDGMEMQLWDKPYDEPLDKHQTMAIYGNVPPLARADKSLEWNRVVVKADGPMISAWVRGELVQQVNIHHHPELKHRGPAGWIGLQDHMDGVRFRDIRVLEAPPGMGLAAWQTPRPATGATALVDRLLNTDKLAAEDGIRSATVSATLSGNSPGEHVLAQLTGPGAIVRIARSGATGCLAFYFDGEPKPRIESDAVGLADAVPSLPGHRSPVLNNPVLTLLPFRKSVKVVLRDASEGEYRFDYVRLPKRLPVETFTDAKHVLPRGWLSAAVYRTLRLRANRFRDFDPMPKVDGEPQTIAPGKTVKLVELDGAGVARWVKLKAEKEVLRTDDLWLEVTVDGEKCPAVSAPARFWFPGLTGPGGFFNYVLFSREGLANILAMPFSDGITVSARNCGKTPIQNVGAQIYYEPDPTRGQIAGRMRLRGVFRRAGQGSDLLACLEGRGRWVGLVYAEPNAENTAIRSLVIDGKPAEGWADARLDGFLGNGSKDFRGALSGRYDGLVWRYLMLAPVDFKKSFVLKINHNCPGDRLTLFYVPK